jgi:hypothetical protein
MAKFKAGDTITNGERWLIISHVAKSTYKIKGVHGWLPIALVDRLWTLADEENTIEE